MAVKWKWNNNTGGGNVPADLEQRVQNLETNAVKITGDQNIAGVKTITASGGVALKFNSGTNNSAYIAGYKSGNSRIWYFGRGSSTDENFVIGSTATIKLEAGREINANKMIVAEQGLKTGASKDITAMNLELGLGGTTAYLTPEDNTNKTLKLHGKPNKGKFDLDFNGQAKVINLPDPTNNQEAATKNYVDNRIKTRTEAITVNANSTYTVNPTNGYQIVSLMVGRKRTNDGMYFFEYQTTLNKQVFLDNTTYKIYNQGNVSGFSNNEFKIVILEMKV